MRRKSGLMAVGAICGGLLLPMQALAETSVTAVDLKMRVGPDTSYGVIDVIPGGHPVEVIGCLSDYHWCDVDWDGLRGWVAARYLLEPDSSVYLPQWAPRVGLPVISFSFTIYHDRHYSDRPWHRERRWAGRWRERREAVKRERGPRVEQRFELSVEQRQELRVDEPPRSPRALKKRGPKVKGKGKGRGRGKK